MEARLWIPALFGVLALIYSALALFGTAASPPARGTRLRIALIFAAVSIFLLLYL